MGDPLKPQKAALGLEVWANGTWDEIEQLRAQLGAIGLIVVPTDGKGRPSPAEPTALGGADRGRYRWYGRVRVRGER